MAYGPDDRIEGKTERADTHFNWGLSVADDAIDESVDYFPNAVEDTIGE